MSTDQNYDEIYNSDAGEKFLPVKSIYAKAGKQPFHVSPRRLAKRQANFIKRQEFKTLKRELGALHLVQGKAKSVDDRLRYDYAIKELRIKYGYDHER